MTGEKREMKKTEKIGGTAPTQGLFGNQWNEWE
jgi:hypothetical protein